MLKPCRTMGALESDTPHVASISTTSRFWQSLILGSSLYGNATIWVSIFGGPHFRKLSDVFPKDPYLGFRVSLRVSIYLGLKGVSRQSFSAWILRFFEIQLLP